MRLFKQLLGVFAVLVILAGLLMTFSYDVIKIQWVSFMGIQPSFGAQEQPLPVPAQSIPVDGAAYIAGNGAPANPVPADEASIARGAQLFSIHCAMCHGVGGEGNGTIAAFLAKKKPAHLGSEPVQSKSDGALFLSISNGIFNPSNSLFPEVEFSGQMPPLNENLTVRERWDVVNFIRTIKAPVQP
ncbi:MAG: cytochrome c [Anaerolineales bacterium]|nr:cytochrome c [Anaerolineales bacterium]MBP6210507.1 cytochrome c [Anaerolineales bacterium]MBP8165487.1 cytochrome c [Anaerolineales bacterium]